MPTFLKISTAALRNHPWLVAGFVLALTATMFFAVRLVAITLYWQDPAHQDQAVAGWMTPGYVLRSWDLPSDTLQAALGNLAQPGSRKSLEKLAVDGGIPPDDLIERIEAAIAAHRADR